MPEIPDTILIVGADRAARAFLGDNLTADGYEVVEAGAVTTARTLLLQTGVDLIVVDRGMPDGDGLALLRFVREADELSPPLDCDLPVILIAEDPSPLDRIRGFERGCDDYLSSADSPTRSCARGLLRCFGAVVGWPTSPASEWVRSRSTRSPVRFGSTAFPCRSPARSSLCS